jgi:hypothetical protein
MTLGFRPLVLFFRLTVLAHQFPGAATQLTEFDLQFGTELLQRFGVAVLDTGGKPKPFSSADERDVDPCF